MFLVEKIYKPAYGGIDMHVEMKYRTESSNMERKLEPSTDKFCPIKTCTLSETEMKC